MDSRPPSEPGGDAGDEVRRKAAGLWYERFQRRREGRLNPRRQAYLRLALIGAALGMLVLGVRLRGDRLDQAMGKGDYAAPRDAAAWSALLSREPELDGARGAAFFPLWESWSRAEDARRRERGRLAARLAELGAERSDFNAAVAEEAERLIGLDSTRAAERARLLRQVRERLGAWRSARLQSLLDEQGL